MAEFLLEILSEEIPARFQANAAADLKRMAEAVLAEQNLGGTLTTHAGPRRLTLVIDGLPVQQADRIEERKGPRVGAPDAAVDGFCKSAGVTHADLTQQDDGKGGAFYLAKIQHTGRKTADVLAEMVLDIIRTFPWPKSMRWGTGELRWVRPIKSIIALFDGQIIPLEIEGIKSGNTTIGHRFMGSGAPFTVKNFADYQSQLEKNGVVPNAETRKTRIGDQITKLCADKGLTLVEDQGLLDEVAGLAEWPVAVLGDMDPAFLDLPFEVIKTTMRSHQRYFTVRDAATGALAPHFITVANIEASDGGKAIAAGNARVLSARLNDARYYYYLDQKTPLPVYAEKFKSVAYYGETTLADRVQWMVDLAPKIAEMIGADAGKARQAAGMAKCDLLTGMVGEFPELQGIMGRYYAMFQGYDVEVCAAIGDQYKPMGSGSAEMSKVSAAVALAEKLTHLAFFFANDLKPTGSKDPYALRRAAIGVIRIVLENGLRLPLKDELESILDAIYTEGVVRRHLSRIEIFDVAAEKSRFSDELISIKEKEEAVLIAADPDTGLYSGVLHKHNKGGLVLDTLNFFLDRLRVLLRDQGFAHDHIDAVLALGDDDLVRVVARLTALRDSADTPAVLAGYTRAANLTKDEKEPRVIDTARLSHDLERQLHSPVTTARTQVETALSTEDFSAALKHLAALRAPIDALCDGLRVNDDDAAIKANRLALLATARDVYALVADFSKIEG